MAGFSRNPSAWNFGFMGINVDEAPDALQPVQYPMAINIRALPDRSVATRPGYEQLFVVESAPVITDTCPITTGNEDEAYTYTFTVVGGTGPYTWSIITGVLPTGLTLNASTGEITGTPTEVGAFSFTIQVEDSLGHFDSKSCSVTIMPVETCGAWEDLVFSWAHNSRIGPYVGPTLGHIFFIGGNPDNLNQLRAVRSIQFGTFGSWAVVDDTFPSLTNEICSFDCHQNNWADDDLVYVTTQEAVTGRVAYHVFDRSASTWLITNVQVVSSVDIDTAAGAGCVGVTVLPNSDIGILYDTNRETVSATLWARSGYRYSTDDGATWSAEIQVGPWGQARNGGPARPVSDNANRVQVFMGNADLAVFFGEYWVQTVRADHTLNTATLWAGGSGLHQIQIARMGDYCTFESGGDTQIVFLGRMLQGAHYTLFESSDDMTAPYQPPDVRDGDIGTTFNGLGGGAYEAAYPQISARMTSDNVLHFMANAFSNSVPTYFYHKVAPSPYAPGDLTPSGDADQSGPIFSISGEGIPGQEMAAAVVEIGGIEYYLSLRDSGTAGYGLIFNMIRTDQLPTSAAETISVWAGECAV
jgi:hypothetical protein